MVLDMLKREEFTRYTQFYLGSMCVLCDEAIIVI